VSSKNIIHEKAYWDTFYKNWGIEVPSQFCVQVITDVSSESVLVEFGSGNGRDSQFMASQGYIVTAMDLSESAIETCSQRMDEHNIQHAFFTRGDVSSEQDVAAALVHARAQRKTPEAPLVAYSRFLLHSLDQEQEDAFITALDKNLLAGDKLYLEYRCTKDAELPKVFGNHYRRYVDTDRLTNLMTETLGFAIDYSITGQGMAKYKDEDPFVSRVIATKR
jgi:hypothetical protein